jgi:histone H3/H4
MSSARSRLRVATRHVPRAVLKRITVEVLLENTQAEVVRIGKDTYTPFNKVITTYITSLLEQAQNTMLNSDREMIALVDVSETEETVTLDQPFLTKETFKSIVKSILPKERRISKEAREYLQHQTQTFIVNLAKALGKVVEGRHGISAIGKAYVVANSDGKRIQRKSKNAGKKLVTVNALDVETIDAVLNILR